jgi:hypothetical protein
MDDFARKAEKLVTPREEARRSTTDGHEFEQQVGELHSYCFGSDDIVEAVGDVPGLIPRCKAGDFVVTLGPDSSAAGAAIVVEAKASSASTLKCWPS